MRKVFVLLFSLFVLSPVLLFANGTSEGSSGGIPTIHFAHTYGQGDPKAPYFEPLLKKFGADHAKEFHLSVATASGDNMYNKIQVELAGNSLPDVWTYWGGSRLLPLIKANKLLNIDKYLAVTTQLKKSDISESAWNLYRVNGGVYGIPIEGYVAAFLCNSQLFKEYGLSYPKTYADMVKDGKVFREHGIIPFAMGSQGGNPGHFWFSEIYAQMPDGVQQMLNLGSSHQFATQNAVHTAQLISDMREAGLFPKDTVANGGWAPSFALYNDGHAAMIYTYPWMLGNMNEKMQKLSVPVAVPKMPGGTVDPSTFISGGAVFGIVANSASFEDPAKQKAMVQLMNFMTSDTTLNALIKGGVIPVKKYNMDMSGFNLVMKNVLSFTKNMKKTTSHYWNFWNNRVSNTFQSSLDELFAGVITPKAFVDKVQAAYKTK